MSAEFIMHANESKDFRHRLIRLTAITAVFVNLAHDLCRKTDKTRLESSLNKNIPLLVWKIIFLS